MGQELAAGFLYAAEMCADFVRELVQRTLDDVFQIAVATDDASMASRSWPISLTSSIVGLLSPYVGAPRAKANAAQFSGRSLLGHGAPAPVRCVKWGALSAPKVPYCAPIQPGASGRASVSGPRGN
jgi:hypothetical protein